jgi:hypothetical protein
VWAGRWSGIKIEGEKARFNSRRKTKEATTPEAGGNDRKRLKLLLASRDRSYQALHFAAFEIPHLHVYFITPGNS